MKVKVLTTAAGRWDGRMYVLREGEETDIPDGLAADVVRAGYAVKVVQTPEPKEQKSVKDTKEKPKRAKRTGKR